MQKKKKIKTGEKPRPLERNPHRKTYTNTQNSFAGLNYKNTISKLLSHSHILFCNLKLEYKKEI